MVSRSVFGYQWLSVLVLKRSGILLVFLRIEVLFSRTTLNSFLLSATRQEKGSLLEGDVCLVFFLFSVVLSLGLYNVPKHSAFSNEPFFCVSTFSFTFCLVSLPWIESCWWGKPAVVQLSRRDVWSAMFQSFGVDSQSVRSLATV